MARRGPSHFPLRKLISSRLWKIIAVSFVAALAAAGILIGGWSAEMRPGALGPGLRHIFQLNDALLVRLYVEAAFTAAAQLAIMIWWLRSQSLHDFNGGYRGWSFVSGACLLAAVAIHTGVFAAAQETAAWLWPMVLAHRAVLCARIAGGTVVFALLRFLVREMRGSLGRSLLFVAIIAAVGWTSLAMGVRLPLGPLEYRIAECAIAMFAALCLCVSLLAHARHVIYVSAAPPEVQAGRLVAMIKRWTSSKRRSETAKPKAKSRSAAAVARARSRLARKRAAGAAAPRVEAAPSTATKGETPPAPAPSGARPAATGNSSATASSAGQERRNPKGDQRTLRRTA